MGSKENNYIERYWRDATPEDAIKEPPMVARFKYEKSGKWKIELLLGFDRDGSEITWSGQSRRVKYCQVYDAPDPGEGWRLIDIDKETPKEGDQYLVHPSQWIDRGDCHGCFKDDKFYRRRIEQPKPEPKYVPFTWEDREQLRGRWITWKHENGLMTESQINHINQHRDGGVWFKSHDAKWLLENATFLDTGEPVGKRVV